jgi:hypothetical protein
VFYRVGTGRLFLNQQAHWNLVAGSLSNVWLGWASIAPGVT